MPCTFKNFQTKLSNFKCQWRPPRLVLWVSPSGYVFPGRPPVVWWGGLFDFSQSVYWETLYWPYTCVNEDVTTISIMSNSPVGCGKVPHCSPPLFLGVWELRPRSVIPRSKDLERVSTCWGNNSHSNLAFPQIGSSKPLEIILESSKSSLVS